MREVKGGQGNCIFTTLRAFLRSGLCATQLCIRSGVVSWMPFNPSSSNVSSCSCSLIRRPPCPTLCWFEEVSWSWSRAGEQRVGLLIQRPGFLCRRVKPLHGMGKLKPGGGLAGRFSTTSSSRRQCWWWGRIWFISHCDSFYKLCSVSLHSEAARADQNWCHRGWPGFLLAEAYLIYFLNRFCFF